MSLRTRREAQEASTRRADARVAVVLKTLVQPALAYVVGRQELYLSARDPFAVVLYSALLAAQSVSTYAKEYELPTGFPRDAIVCSNLLSKLTPSAIVGLLGPA